MEKKLQSYHHFKGNDLSPSEKVQQKVIELLLTTRIPDSQRDSSIVFELKHSTEVAQIARILSQKRNLNITLCEVIAVLHDISVIVTGSYKTHAISGGPIAEKILIEIGGFSQKEIQIIIEGVVHHSEKELISENPYVEMIKDADVFACSYLENAEDGYRLGKSSAVFKSTTERIKKVRKELGLLNIPIYRK
ncbi:MAG: HD domain-containing protein [bacterium]|nr:HD domain-containing protein [bacterium]